MYVAFKDIIYEIYSLIILLEFILHGILLLEFCSNYPIAYHRYFIEPLTCSFLLNIMFCSRFVSFVRTLESSSKLSIRLFVTLLKTNQKSLLAKPL